MQKFLSKNSLLLLSKKCKNFIDFFDMSKIVRCWWPHFLPTFSTGLW